MTSHELRPEGATNEQISEIPDRRTHRTWNDVPVGMSSDRGGSGKAVLYSQARGYVGGTPCRVDSIRLDPGDTFGAAVAISDETAVIGPRGTPKGQGEPMCSVIRARRWRQVLGGVERVRCGCQRQLWIRCGDCRSHDRYRSSESRLGGRTGLCLHEDRDRLSSNRRTERLQTTLPAVASAQPSASRYKHRGWITEPSSECRPKRMFSVRRALVGTKRRN